MELIVGGADLLEADTLEESLHICQRVDGDADAPDFSHSERVIGVHTHLCGQIEGNGKTRDALRQEIFIAPVALFRRTETGVLAHGPEAAAVHVGIDAASERELAGLFQGVRRHGLTLRNAACFEERTDAKEQHDSAEKGRKRQGDRVACARVKGAEILDGITEEEQSKQKKYAAHSLVPDDAGGTHDFRHYVPSEFFRVRDLYGLGYSYSVS